MLTTAQRQAPFKLDIIIVGGALAGLSTALGLALSGHKVRVLEKMSRFGEPVGGVNVGPNVTKILTGWGLEKELEKMGAVVHDGSKLWDFETGKLIGYLAWAEPIIKDTGSKFYLMRYSDLHGIIYDAATRAGAEVIFNADVRLASPPPQGTSDGRPSVQLRDGTVLYADMIIGADGRHSTVRTSFQEKHVEPQATETVVFTGQIPLQRFLEDDKSRVDKIAYSWVYWLGPGRAVSLYPIAHNSEFAIHLCCDREDPDTPEGWIPNVPIKSLKLTDTTLDNRLARVFEKIDALSWKRYLDWPSFEDWSDESNRIVLVGESSRPLIPCSTQSCSLVVEGAAVLSTLLSYVRGFDHIPLLVGAYETLRRDRSEFLHQVDLGHVKQTMLPHGPERTARDADMGQYLDAGQIMWEDDAYLGLWAQMCEILKYNAFDAADDWWVEWGVLRERALTLQDPSVGLQFRPIEVGISARTDVADDFSTLGIVDK